MEKKEEAFTYTYSAQKQTEVEQIRSKYIPKEENKMDQLRRLDRIPSQKARGWALTVGVIGALLLGIGMSLTMTDLGTVLGIMGLPVGIAVGLAGLVLVALAYPVYNSVLKKHRMRLAPQILQLTEELLK